MQAAEQIDDEKISLETLRGMIEEHLLWLQSEGKTGRRANLAGQDLSGINMKGAYMPDANFRNAILTGTDFSEANLQGADFSGAQLEQTNFRGASLDGANFAQAEARRAYFDKAQAVEANFSNVVMEGASASEADFSGVKFRDAILSRSDFTGAKLLYANLRYSRAAECVFDQADLSRADCRDTIFDFTRFKEANLFEANMRNASFEQVHFTDTDFSHVIDLDVQYQSESFALEKQSIRKEIENLTQVKDEVSQYESQINKNRREISQQRKVLLSLNELETEVSGALLKHMTMFRRIAIFWFIVVAIFATIVAGRVVQSGLDNLGATEIGMVTAILGGVLGAHILSAALSFNMARQFARYVRLRREKLSQVTIQESEAPKAYQAPPVAAGSNMTYL